MSKNVILKDSKGKIITQKIVFRRNVFTQGTGLMLRSAHSVNDTAWIFVFNTEKKRAITMWFVLFSIDVVFLDKNKKIVELVSLTSWSNYFPKKPSQYVVELEQGMIQKKGLNLGQKLVF